MKKKLEPSFDGAEALARIGANLRTARLRRGETESTLADRLGVSRATIARLERGDGGVSLALALEALLQYGYAEQVFALGDPELDGVGKRLDAVRRPSRGSAGTLHTHRADPSRL
ncbi:XRE family transcriptional regulator [Achromobacter denitrificans]|jgi:transcriptional regulator with XRE-family HTH domain|uniref:Helix-turn-helix transcriptional regulator n=1 Tax=Achromobacter denitrificans TaxID=32002 RepID=A0A427WMY2_ACHDE|nr:MULTISPECIES: helix-turn-helix transcriptional regulator [Achromobacter]ASC67745.1 XRE family transcriptional regulator [Achromobacter denitrificans]MBV2158517.1 helix-turn-helix domain-containing protein [Achromobacter denitrificans]MDF3850520.1 helix-turn-helix transcriptional regulator [Achromobacter denitrificans]MDF3857142.1 helix-turn-helix transcriptional regulator [Achromobacter denitrificans]MDF3942954.1 helix-turn-helix transcriptional regulator [Achromobacter denitrificans]